MERLHERVRCYFPHEYLRTTRERYQNDAPSLLLCLPSPLVPNGCIESLAARESPLDLLPDRDLLRTPSRFTPQVTLAPIPVGLGVVDCRVVNDEGDGLGRPGADGEREERFVRRKRVGCVDGVGVG